MYIKKILLLPIISLLIITGCVKEPTNQGEIKQSSKYEFTISEEKSIELAEEYMAKYTDYKAESFKVLNVATECGDTFYCIEAYGKDSSNSLVNVGYFEVHVENGLVRGDIYPPKVENKKIIKGYSSL